MKSFNIGRELNLPELDTYLKRLQKLLDSTLPDPSSTIYAPLKHVITAPSKRLRASLVIASHGSNKPIDETVISTCAAVELIHLGSLVHDDIMDESDMRWNSPTINKKEGINTAILAGDYLFAKANSVVSSLEPTIALTVAETITKLCEGQAQEMADIQNVDRTHEAYLDAIKGKTGSLLSAACKLGAVCAQVKPAEVEAFSQFGSYFGISFQILDDILDFISTDDRLGKPVSNDVIEGIYTLPVILALQGTDRKKMLSVLQDAINVRKSSATLLFHEGYIRQAIKEMQKYNIKASQYLEPFAANKLSELPFAYTNWALSELVADNYL